MTGCLAAARGWRPADRIERAAADQMRAFGPETGGAAVYVAFPWAALIDSLAAPLDDPELATLHADVLRTALRALCADIAPGAAALTVCQHPGLRDRFDLMTQAGITEVFWTHATAADLRDSAVPGLRIRPYPALSGTARPSDALALSHTAARHDIAPDTAPASALTLSPDASGFPDGPPAGEGPGAAFVFCPGDSGGNTPRLWGAIAAGLVPVIPLAEAALPGLPALWRDGAVFHDARPGDQPDDRDALDSRLAAIAADPDRLAAMRAALDQLWLLYGTGRSAHGVALRMIDLACAAAAAPRPPATDPLSFEAARQVLRAAAGDLLLRGAPDVGPGVEAALARLPALAPARLHFEAVRAHLQKPAPLSVPLWAPGHTTGQPPAIFLLGPRGQRTPLAYDPLRRQAGARVRFVDRLDRADLILTGWNRDLEDNRDRLRDLLRARPATRIAVISEEPLWDSLWSGGFAARDRSLSVGDAEIPYRFLNHANSGIFDFRRIPYFLLTRDTFPARYATLIAGFAGLAPTALLQHWRDTPLRYAVFAAYRDTADYAASFPEQDLYGLSLYRSRIAALTPEEGVLRVGQGWAGTGPPRQALPDWHLDKLARLHGRVRVCAAQENTLMRDYITEKPFDAFAVGAIPAVVAGPDHRLGELLEPDAMLDTAGLTPDLAAARIATFAPDRVTAYAWRASAARLVALMRDTDALIAERRRVVDATLAEIAALV